MQFVLNFYLALKFSAPVSDESGAPESSTTFFQASQTPVEKTAAKSLETFFLTTLHCSLKKLLLWGIDLVTLQMVTEIFVVGKLLGKGHSLLIINWLLSYV